MGKLLFAFLLSLTATAFAFEVGDTVNVKPGPIGEFRRSDIGIGCTYEADGNASSCLKIGNIFVGDELETIEKTLGKPRKIIPQSGNAEARIYAAKWQQDGQYMRLASYWAITYREGKANSIQISGEAISSDFAFSSISLGDSSEKIIQLLGRPASTQRIQHMNAWLWDYYPHPFSFEIKDQTVSSIRVTSY